MSTTPVTPLGASITDAASQEPTTTNADDLEFINVREMPLMQTGDAEGVDLGAPWNAAGEIPEEDDETIAPAVIALPQVEATDPLLAAEQEVDPEALREMASELENFASPELAGAGMFQSLMEEQELITARQVELASRAARIITGALTGYVGETDPLSRITQDILPVLRRDWPQVEMTTKVTSKMAHIRGTYTVWVDIDTAEGARCGLTIKRSLWRKPMRFSMASPTELLEALARQFSLDAMAL